MTEKQWFRCNSFVKLSEGLPYIPSKRKRILYICVLNLSSLDEIWKASERDRIKFVGKAAEHFADGIEDLNEILTI